MLEHNNFSRPPRQLKTSNFIHSKKKGKLMKSYKREREKLQLTPEKILNRCKIIALHAMERKG
jgi:hypothetical protein